MIFERGSRIECCLWCCIVAMVETGMMFRVLYGNPVGGSSTEGSRC